MGKVIETHIEDEMEESYINYAMSVIRGRAIPNVRDGLKPVQLRILYGMHQLGLASNKPTRKSARIVGEVMGKYHPHGDRAVYDAMVNMAQEFSYRYPLVDGQGNFGSLDGDAPAAMRYTEARLSPISESFLEEIGEDTVDFRPNFDDSLEEPVVLPTKVPNLLLNGSWGISVGMVTKIPPHNLNEVVDALVAQMKDPQISLARLMEYIKGPDFPTGGIVMGQDQITKTYRTGRGKLKMRAKARVEGNKIVITEIPYQIKKSTIVESIAKRVRNEEIEGISDLRDESDQKGLRIVVELKRSTEAELVLKQLYNYTPLERTFGAHFLVIKEGNPQMLSLKEILSCFIEHRRQVVTRRTNYRLDKAEARAHILEGLTEAIENKEELVKIISQAESTDQAKQVLKDTYQLSKKQVKGVLRIRLSQFTKMEVAKIKDEHDQKLKEIKRYREILGDKKELDGIIVEQLLELKEKFGDPRRTTVVDEIEEPDFESLIPDHDLLFTITEKGYTNAPRQDIFKKQHRAGKGVIGLRVNQDDRLLHIFPANSREDILIFSADNQVYGLHASHLPNMRRDSKGKMLKDLIELEDGERIQTVLSLDKNLLASQKSYCLMATESGIVNRNSTNDFQNAYTGGIIAIDCSSDDQIVDAKLAVEEDEVILATACGQTIRFPSSEVRCTGRPSKGVIGIRLNRGDEVVGMATINPNSPRDMLLLVTEKGYGKRTDLEEFTTQSRGGKGNLGIKISRKTGKVVSVKTVSDKDDVILITQNGKIIKINADSVRTVGRYAKGVHLIKLDEDDKVTSIVVA